MLIQKPIFSAKSLREHQKNKVYSFYVLPSANKFQIKKEFEKLFRVQVKKVRTSRQKPVLAPLRWHQKKPGKIYTKLRKKALVELSPGQQLPFFFSNA